jgi:hypothetical protein
MPNQLLTARKPEAFADPEGFDWRLPQVSADKVAAALVRFKPETPPNHEAAVRATDGPHTEAPGFATQGTVVVAPAHLGEPKHRALHGQLVEEAVEHRGDPLGRIVAAELGGTLAQHYNHDLDRRVGNLRAVRSGLRTRNPRRDDFDDAG